MSSEKEAEKFDPGSVVLLLTGAGATEDEQSGESRLHKNNNEQNNGHWK